nr:Lrp/AsnC ligand binding domain-containing protein [Plasticicumulans acidivorans]
MVTALVLLNTEKGRINEVAEALAALPGITEVYSLAGIHDLAAIIRVGSNDELADVVTHHMLKVDGIRDSQTHVAFRVHSKHDLDDMFAIGNEEAG